MRRCLFVVLASVVFCCSIWPTGIVSAQEESPGDTASEGQYSNPPPTEAPQEGAASEQYASPPDVPPAPQEQAATPTATDPVTAPAPQAASTAPPPSPTAAQYAEEPPLVAGGEPTPAPVEEAVAASEPLAQTPLPADAPAPYEPPPPSEPAAQQGVPFSGEDEGTISPDSHCSGGLFGPGPREGTPCPGTTPPPPAAPEQYQYTPGSETAAEPPAPQPDPEPAATEPQPSDPEPQPNEPAAAEPVAPQPAPQTAPADDGPYYYYGCYDVTCGLDVPHGYACEKVLAEGVSPVSGEPERYECTRGGETFDFVEGPEGESCLAILVFEDEDSEGIPGFRCQNLDTGGLCNYDADWVQQECQAPAPPDAEFTDPFACGEDDCGVNAPPGYECTEQFGKYRYKCSDPNGDMVTSPHGSECDQILLFRDADDSSPMVWYACDEPGQNVNGVPYCGYYDSDWRPLPCYGGGVSTGAPAFQNAEEAQEVVSNGRKPGAPGLGGAFAYLGGGGWLGPPSSDGSAGPRRAPQAVLDGGSGADGAGPASSPQNLAMIAVLGDTAGASATGGPHGGDTVALPVGYSLGDAPAPDDRLSGLQSFLAEGTIAPREERPPSQTSAPLLGPANPLLPDAVPRPGAATAQQQKERALVAVSKEAVRRAAFVGPPGANDAYPLAALGDRGIPSGEPPKDASKEGASPQRTPSLTDVAVALLAVGAVLAVGGKKLRGTRR